MARKSEVIRVFLLLLISVGASGQRPELVVGTLDSLNSGVIALSPDGRTIVTSNKKILDLATGYELRTLPGASNSTAFHPNGRVIAFSGLGIELWDTVYGQLLLKRGGPTTDYGDIAFSPDGRILAAAGEVSAAGEAIELWDMASGASLSPILQRSGITITSLSFTPDGRLLIGGGGDFDDGRGEITAWNVADHRVVFSLTDLSHVINAIAISPDSRVLASGSVDETIKLWDLTTGNEIRTLASNHNEPITEKDPTSGEIRTYVNQYPSSVTSIAFNTDGTILATGSRDQTITLWNTSSGLKLKTLLGHKREIASLQFTKENRLISSADSIRIWDVDSGTVLRTINGHSSAVRTLAFTPDGRTLAIGSESDTVKLWSLAQGIQIVGFKGKSRYIKTLAYSPNGKIFAAAGGTLENGSYRNGWLGLWNRETSEPLRGITEFPGGIDKVAFSPDGTLLAISDSNDRTLITIDVKTGRRGRSFPGHPGRINDIAFSVDGGMIAAGGGDYGHGSITLWDVASGRKVRSEDRNLDLVLTIAFNPDGTTIACGSWLGRINVFDSLLRGKIKSIPAHFLSAETLAFDRTGKWLASGGRDGWIRLWNTATWELMETLNGHGASVTSLVFSPEGRILASGGYDNLTKLWDIQRKSELASLISIDEVDWAVVAPNGLFDGSPPAWDKMIWRSPSNTFDFASVEAYFSDFFRPGLLSDIASSGELLTSADIATKDRRQPAVSLSPLKKSPAEEDARFVTLRIEVRASLALEKAPDASSSATRLSAISNSADTGSGARDLRLFRNGSLIKVWHGDVLNGEESVTFEERVPIVAGENRFTVYAFNHDNIKSSDATLVVTGADSLKRPGTAYVLAVGVNTYSNTNYNLKYAVPDAQDFAAEIKRQQESLKKYERVEVMPLYDKDATKANVLRALSNLASKAQPEDAVVVYFSGHGTAAEQRFYLIPHDLGYQGPRTKLSAGDLKTILDHSISDRELEAAFEKIDAGQFLMVIDACNSGQALDSEEKRRGPMNSKGLAQLAYEKGMYILTAAQSYQAAWEASRLGHGYLTYALIEEGLKQGTADRDPKNNEIVLREWLDYATERVPRLQEEKMKEKPKRRDRRGRKELEFVFVEGDETIKDPTKRNIQRPRVFYRRELESSPMVVARPLSPAPARN